MGRSAARMATCLQNNMWGGAQNVAGLFLDSSGSKRFTFDAATSTVLTVQTSSIAVGCDWDGWGNAANAAAALQGINTDTYDYRLYYFPGQNSCEWTNLAYFGCSEPRYCRAHTVSPSPLDPAHALGHSAGTVTSLQHCWSCVRFACWPVGHHRDTSTALHVRVIVFYKLLHNSFPNFLLMRVLLPCACRYEPCELGCQQRWHCRL